ncbi:TIGR00730 family Rossman fold protein [Sphingobium algorifonticola]|uniref:Cytokinin riboside 5'-monophosphate phosphoribohydrolase n=1 Tax=Sphingobium algorifonticola TaxID=2008318 RepID=A0A437JC91_9SPHN|nr:TIGR00730 family Rossman fold protein [Sphingobium algorifonticola]RVT43505.1 TIGR00730 family Rossman fold protein [Sphingobium algorifonticola]
MKRLAVYCGSATPADPAYIETARHVGRTLAAQGIGVVYGGGRLGLMGAVADAALDAGGEVIGVIPQALVGVEVAHRGCTDLRIVANMHERKALFTDLSDGFVTLPGGVGTMDELWEAVSWAQLGYHEKPVGLLNAAGFYDHLIAFNRHMIDTGFIRPAHARIIVQAETIETLLVAMAAYQPHETIFRMKAAQL